MDTTSVPSNGKSRFTAPIIAGVSLCAALVGGNVYFANRTNDLQGELKGLRTSVSSEIGAVSEKARASDMQRDQSIAELQKALEASEAKAQKATQQANAASRRYSDSLAKKLADQHQQDIEKNSTQWQEQLTTQIGEVKQSATEINDKVGGIATDVGTVKTDVANTRTELEKTIGDLKSVRGDLGVQSGLIATNSKELDALRQLGERSYVEFELPKTKTPQKVGDVAMQLKKWDAKRNRFTIELLANDKKVEKKDRTVNEPVQFYTSNARIPYEIVVNEVRQNMIVGYLAIPKVKATRN